MKINVTLSEEGGTVLDQLEVEYIGTAPAKDVTPALVAGIVRDSIEGSPSLLVEDKQ